jgi:hypothetical protein
MSLVPSNKEKIQEEISKLKSLKGAKRWEYIWEYYKLFIFGLALALLIAGTSIYSSIINPNPTIVLNVAWTHGPQLFEFHDHLADDLTTSLTDPYQNEIVIVMSFVPIGDPQIDMGNQMRFAAMLTAAELDIVIATREEIVESAADGLLLDISSFVPRGTEGLVRTEGAGGRLSNYGISILNSSYLENESFFMSDACPPPYVGVFINTTREDMARLAILRLLET